MLSRARCSVPERRVTTEARSGMPAFASLAAARAGAAAIVVLFHLGGTFAQDKYFGLKAFDGPFAWGDAGVEFFFVLSGFLITLVHRHDVGRPHALGNYLLKRALRIYPAYWLVCVAVCLAAFFAPSLRSALPGDPLVFLKALALVPQDPAVVGGTGAPILFVAWSMQYELLFYAMAGLFIASRTAGWTALMALAITQVGCRLTDDCGFAASFLSSNLMLLFALGSVSARLACKDWRLPRPALVASLGLVAFVAFGAFEVRHGRNVFGVDRRLIYGVLAGFIVVALVKAEAAGSLTWLRRRSVVLLGDASYALYLLHIPVISVLCKLTLPLGAHSTAAMAAIFAGVFAACVASALTFHMAIEQPLVACLRSRLRPLLANRKLAQRDITMWAKQ